MKTYYEVLEIDPSSSPEGIRAAYKAKLLENHPDKVTTTTTEITHIQRAYQVLMDPHLRQTYDKDIVKTAQTQGFNINGDGLDVFNLSEFECGEETWVMDCPRCQSHESMILMEEDLENGSKEGEVIVQCGDCSLWIKVEYEEEE